MLEKNPFVRFLLENDNFSTIWKSISNDPELYIQYYIDIELNDVKDLNIKIHYNGFHILSLKYTNDFIQLKDERKNNLDLKNILSIIDSKKEEYKSNSNNDEPSYQYHYSAFDKRIIFTEYWPYFRGVRTDLILADSKTKKIYLVEIKKLENKDFKSGKAKNQLIEYMKFIENDYSMVKCFSEAQIKIRKSLGLYKESAIHNYKIEKTPILLIINSDDMLDVDNHRQKYGEMLLNYSFGIIYTNKIILNQSCDFLIDLKKLKKEKIYYEII